MAASSKTLTGGSSELIIAADVNRDHLTIQLYNQYWVYLAFGEAAADATGVRLQFPGDTVRVTGPKARLAVYGWGQTQEAAVLGIETCEDVEYRPGPNRYPDS